MSKTKLRSSLSRSPGGVVIMLAAIFLGCLSTFADSPRVPFSFIWSLSSLAWSSIILWPLTLGVGAVVGVRFSKSGSNQLVAAFPQSTLWKLHMRSAVLIGAWASAGVIVASLIVAIVALSNGSPFSWQALLPLPILLMGSMVWPIVGYGIGLAVAQWWIGPLVAFGMYGLAAFDVANFSNVFYFAGHVSDWVIVQAARTEMLVTTAGFLLASFIAASWITWAANVSSTPQRVASALLLFVLMVTSGSVIGKYAYSDNWRGDESWPCVEMAITGEAAKVKIGEVCLPSDQARDLPELGASLGPMVERLYQVDPEIFPLRLSAHPDNPMIITMPIGMQHFDADVAALDLVYGTTDCFEDFPDKKLVDYLYVVTLWIHPTLELDPYLYSHIQPRPPSLGHAHEAYTHLKECSS